MVARLSTNESLLLAPAEIGIIVRDAADRAHGRRATDNAPATATPFNALVTDLKLDKDAQALMQAHLDSFEKLELVRALRASVRPMSRTELERECRFSPDTVLEALGSLSQMNVVELDAERSFARLGKVAQDPAFDALMRFYDDDRSAVLAMLSKVAMERIRSMAARAFADAFILRRKQGDDDG